MAKKRRSRSKNRPPPPPPPPPVEFKTGDFVLAKMKGYPPWPATIATPEQVELSPKPGKFPVIFFGDKTQALISVEKLTLFRSDSYGVLPEITRYQRKFADAVRCLRAAIVARDAEPLNQTPPEPEPIIQETLQASPKNMRDLILKAKSIRDWTLDVNRNEFVLEEMENSIKLLGSKKGRHSSLAKQAIDWGKLGYVTEVLNYMILMIETSSAGHKLRYFSLLVELVKQAFERQDTIGQEYLVAVEKNLIQIVNAAAPVGSYARVNRKRFLEVLKHWQKEVFTSSVLDQLIGDVEQRLK